MQRKVKRRAVMVAGSARAAGWRISTVGEGLWCRCKKTSKHYT